MLRKKKREVFIERKVYHKCTTSLANRSIKVSAVPKVQKLCVSPSFDGCILNCFHSVKYLHVFT